MGRLAAASIFDQLADMYRRSETQRLGYAFEGDQEGKAAAKKQLDDNIKQLRKAHSQELDTIFYESTRNTKKALKNDLKGVK